jgi:hypothetical protein
MAAAGLDGCPCRSSTRSRSVRAGPGWEDFQGSGSAPLERFAAGSVVVSHPCCHSEGAPSPNSNGHSARARPKNLVAAGHDPARARRPPRATQRTGRVPALQQPDSSVGAIQPGKDPDGASLRMTATGSRQTLQTHPQTALAPERGLAGRLRGRARPGIGCLRVSRSRSFGRHHRFVSRRRPARRLPQETDALRWMPSGVPAPVCATRTPVPLHIRRPPR